ncbi:F-box domain containing protein [Hordeum vulgare]|nr:F-box domain containing protein [Hordeum vulgare]
MAEISPLHWVIDAARWDAERLLGRLIILVHAAFLDAGFVVHADRVGKSGRVPTRAGATASNLSLVYAASLRRDAAVPLHMRAHGMHIVFYVCVPRFAQDPRPGVHWACVDARSAAPLLSGGLDDTARALTDEGTSWVAAFWREVTEELCRRALVAMCPDNSFVSLPVDVTLEILARLTDGLSLLRVASTCAGLRRLVADHDRELWKHRYEALPSCAWANDDSSKMTWMERWCKKKQSLAIQWYKRSLHIRQLIDAKIRF